MSRRTDHFPVLALALLQGRWTRNALRKRARDLLGPRSKTRANRLVDEILAVHRLPYTPGWRTLTKIVAGASALHGLSDATIERVQMRQSNVWRPPLGGNAPRDLNRSHHCSLHPPPRSPPLPISRPGSRFLLIILIGSPTSAARLTGNKTRRCHTTRITGASSGPAHGASSKLQSPE